MTLKSLLQYHSSKVSIYCQISYEIHYFNWQWCVYAYICVLSHSVLSNSATPWTIVHQVPMYMGILQTRILEWVAMPSSRVSSHPRDRTWISCTAGDSLPSEPPGKTPCVYVGKHYGKLDHKVKHADVLIILTHTFWSTLCCTETITWQNQETWVPVSVLFLTPSCLSEEHHGIQGNKYMYLLLLALSITIIYL